MTIWHIYKKKYSCKGKYTSFNASRIHLPGCPALLLLLHLHLLLYFPLDSEYFVALLPFLPLPARCFLCNISTLQQRAKTLTLTFTFSFCCVLFPAFLLHDANWLLGCRSSAVLCSAVRCHLHRSFWTLLICSSSIGKAAQPQSLPQSLPLQAHSKSCVASGVARTQKDPEREPESVSDNIKKKTTLAIVIN